MAKNKTDLDNGVNVSRRPTPVIVPILVFLLGVVAFTTFGFFGQEIQCDIGHQYGSWCITQAPECVTDGVERRECAICDHFELQSVPSLGHIYNPYTVDPGCTSQGFTRHTCERCDDYYDDTHVEAVGHSFTIEVSSVSPTCMNGGSVTYQCASCDSQHTDPVDALGHRYTISEDIAPTCSEQGYTLHTCTACNDSYQDNFVDTIEHVFSDWKIMYNPTCTISGTEQRVCQDCGYIDEKTNPPRHTYIATVVKPTCEEQGYVLHTCSCGDSYVDAYVEPLGHNHIGIITVPTCSEQGYTTYTCYCGDSYVDTYVEATGDHPYVDAVTPPTCIEQGFTAHTCSYCGDRYVDAYVEATGDHPYVDAVTPPTCIEQGFTAHTCSYCGDRYVDAYVEPLGHNHIGIITVPTCSEQGYTTYTCFCGDSYIGSYVKPTGDHTFATTIVKPSCTEQGYTVYTCSNCGESYVDEYVEVLKHVTTQKGTILKSATEDTNGTKKYVCSICGDSFVEEYEYYSSGLVFTLNYAQTAYIVSDFCGSGKVIIPSVYERLPVREIQYKAFQNCTGVTSIIIPDSVTYIESNAFDGCARLTNVSIPNSITSIGVDLFKGCSSLKYHQYENAFYLGNESNHYLVLVSALDSTITSCEVALSTRFIYGGAFSGCSKLTRITIPESVISIGAKAFSNCSALTDVYITDLASWCQMEFGSTGSYAEYANPLWAAENLYLDGVLMTELIVPDGVTTISKCAFVNRTNWTSIAIPASVTSIGYDAFYGISPQADIYIADLVAWCGMNHQGGTVFHEATFRNLYINGELTTDLIIPDGVTSISQSAFSGFTRLKTVTIPDSVTSIGGNAFESCFELTSIIIPDSVTEIGDLAFIYCHALQYNRYQNAYYLGNDGNPYLVLIEALDNGTGTCIIHPNTKLIYSYAFSGCTWLTSIAVPNRVITIGYSAFDDCTGLTSIIIPSSVTKIERFAFSDCDNLSSVTFKNTSGWRCTKYSSNTIPATALTNPKTAASYLTATYCSYYWERT